MLLDGFRLIIFDADETLRRTTVPGKPCPHGPAEWMLLPNVRATLRHLPWMQPGGPQVGLASNQDHVGYGHLSFDAARGLLRDLAVAAIGVAPPDVALQLCPHTLEIDCECRKPKPAMLLKIMGHYAIGAEDTLLVGNSEVDRLAADAAGIGFVSAASLFGSNEGRR